MLAPNDGNHIGPTIHNQCEHLQNIAPKYAHIQIFMLHTCGVLAPESRLLTILA